MAEFFVLGIASTIAAISAGFLYARKAYRTGYMSGVEDSKSALKMMMEKGDLVPGGAPYEDVDDSGDFGPIPAAPRRKSNVN